ncbi:MAG: SpoIID/LytB domain-containing protein, partial [Firmicutes bacterium]|nr:SpoIID/LytB domain-containing protein [Bacillota bacterium]
MSVGRQRVKVVTAMELLPIQGARVITRKDGQIIGDQITDANGMTEFIDIAAPNPALTLRQETAAEGISFCDVEVTMPGYETVHVHDIEILGGQESFLPVQMHPLAPGWEGSLNDPETEVSAPVRDIVIPRRGFDNDATVTTSDNLDDIYVGVPAVLQRFQSGSQGVNLPSSTRRVVIPTYITVRLGAPTNNAARNVRVPFVEYVANVASSEIFATWPRASLFANIHAITTFALNRIFTEWYRSRGQNFDITNTTQFDQFFVYGRNIFQNLMQISAEVFNQYVHRAGFANPLFTSYRANACGPNCMSQWGTVDLANRGFNQLQILRNFYGQDVQIGTSNNIQDVTTTYPGTPL